MMNGTGWSAPLGCDERKRRRRGRSGSGGPCCRSRPALPHDRNRTARSSRRCACRAFSTRSRRPPLRKGMGMGNRAPRMPKSSCHLLLPWASGSHLWTQSMHQIQQNWTLQAPSSGSLSLPTAPAIASPICGPIVMKDVPRAARAKQNPIWGARKPTISPQPTSPAPAPVLAPSVHGFPSGRRRRPGGQTRNSNVDPRNFIPLGRRTSPCCAAKGDAPVPPSSTAAARGAKPVVTPPCHPVPKATALPLVRPPEAAVRQACQPVERCFLCHTLLQQHARLLPCGHGFHRKCIQEWGEEDADCPVCCTRTTAVLAEIRGMFRRGHLPEMRDDVSSGASECMEAGFEEMMAEERHSRHVGHREDREEWRRTLAEEAEEAALRKRLRRR
eukprot:GGOE01053420.1.p1 GENE.GGOE01053420.1~~GGOE01053420.1.p1  ORF type:complete len:401 (+),score=32.79 GGOE01053420.1:46-1203(+)